MKRNIFVTGAAGFVGRIFLHELARHRGSLGEIIGADVRVSNDPIEGVRDVQVDIRSPEILDFLKDHRIHCVVHLAAIVNPSNTAEGRELEYAVDVLGTGNVVRACLAARVDHFVYSSSGAAYGYHGDNPALLSEEDPLRGNDEFSYSRNKRLVEEMLAETRRTAPQLRQLILRPGTILGEGVSNSITNLFEKPTIVGVMGSDSPFCMIWHRDVARALVKGVLEEKVGIYNLAGDGALALREIARRMGASFVALPAGLMRAALAVGSRVGLTRYGPEMLNFVRYRPVLGNERLKRDFGYTPEKTSEEVFETYRAWRMAQSG